MVENRDQTLNSDNAFCTSCGSEIAPDVDYCPNCDAEQLTIDQHAAETTSKAVNGTEETQPVPEDDSLQPETGQSQPASTEPATENSTDEVYIPNDSASETNCQQCGTTVKSHEWFCSFCGKERPMCPDCGAEMDEEQCKNCDTHRKAPCGNCGLTIDASLQECPNCEYNESESVATMSADRKKKALGLGGVGGVAFLVVSSIVPGPAIIGGLLGALVSSPFVIYGGLIAFYYNKKESNAEERTAADLSKGREQNKTKEWRDMKREERKEMLRTAAQGLNAAGKAASAYEEKKRKEQKEERLDEKLQTADQMQQQAQQEIQHAQQEKQHAQQKQQQAEQKKKQIEESVADVPKGCPRCQTKWRGSGGMLSSQNYEELAPGMFQCMECGREVNLG